MKHFRSFISKFNHRSFLQRSFLDQLHALPSLVVRKRNVKPFDKILALLRHSDQLTNLLTLHFQRYMSLWPWCPCLQTCPDRLAPNASKENSTQRVHLQPDDTICQAMQRRSIMTLYIYNSATNHFIGVIFFCLQDHYIILRYFSSELKGCKLEIKVGIRKTCK